MSQETSIFSRKGLWICAVAAALACAWMCSDAFAGKKGNNASDQGQANGVAHRVDALEAAMADTQSALADALDRITLLEGDVTDLETRVAALEAAAAAP
jgi:hypothetical protein